MHSTFPRRTKLWIIGMITISGFLSPLSLNIYFPVLPVLARDLGVTVSLINLSVTSYQIIQALAPMFFGNFGDTAGRRPAFIICLAIYIGANIGLAFQRNYTTLLVLRGVQSFGISGTLAQCYAVVADMTTVSHLILLTWTNISDRTDQTFHSCIMKLILLISKSRLPRGANIWEL